MSTEFEGESLKAEQPPKSADEIERDIDHTRAELHRTLDALEAKLSVRRKVDKVKNSARNNAYALAEKARETVKRYPLPTGFAGGLLLGLLASLAVPRRR